MQRMIRWNNERTLVSANGNESFFYSDWHITNFSGLCSLVRDIGFGVPCSNFRRREGVTVDSKTANKRSNDRGNWDSALSGPAWSYTKQSSLSGKCEGGEIIGNRSHCSSGRGGIISETPSTTNVWQISASELCKLPKQQLIVALKEWSSLTNMTNRVESSRQMLKTVV